jgi:DinB superfamily
MTEEFAYPIGRFPQRETLTATERQDCIADLEQAPALLRNSIQNLNQNQLEHPYRDGGWNSHQVIHHVADSHMRGLILFKLGLTENAPNAFAYNRSGWADLPDSQHAPIATSLDLIAALHQRWATLLQHLNPEDFSKTVIIPDGTAVTLDGLLNIYSWHGKHHAAQIHSLRQRQEW